MPEPTPPPEIEKLLEEAQNLFRIDPVAALGILEKVRGILGDDPDPHLHLKTVLASASAHLVANDGKMARTCLEEASSLLPHVCDDRSHAAYHNTCAIFHSREGRSAESIRHQMQSITHGRACGDDSVVGHLASNLALEFIYTGDFEQASFYLEESLDSFRKAKDPGGRANALMNLGLLHYQQNQYEEAARFHREALSIYSSEGARRSVILARLNLATALRQMGQSAEATALARINYNEAREIGGLHYAHALDSLASLLLDSGQDELSREYWKEALSIYQSHGSLRGQALVLENSARLHPISSGEHMECLRNSLAMAIEADMKPDQVRLHRSLAEAAKAANSWKEAFQSLQSASELESAISTDKSRRRMEILQIRHGLDQARLEATSERTKSIDLMRALEEVDRMRKSAEEQNRQKSVILRMAAHDLRNLAGAVQQCLATALDEESPPDLRSEMLVLSQEASTHLLKTLNQLMSASAIEEGRLEVHPVDIRWAEFLPPLQQYWEMHFASKNQTLVTEIIGTPILQADPDRLREILDNLLGNAGKYSPAGAHITLRAIEERDRTEIEVRDEGPGIPVKEQPFLFRAFQKLSPRPTGDEISTGLGLFIVKTLLDRQEGSIRMHNLDEKGACFRVTLPKPNSPPPPGADCPLVQSSRGTGEGP